jgi:hypothetical protein
MLKQYLLGIGLALLTIPIIAVTALVFPDIGWNLLYVVYIAIFIFQMVFYYLTTNFKLAWTVLSFILNFVFWTFEQVILEKNFHESFIYSGDHSQLGVFTLGGFLWVTNKIVIDKVFTFNKSIHKYKSKMNV